MDGSVTHKSKKKKKMKLFILFLCDTNDKQQTVFYISNLMPDKRRKDKIYIFPGQNR